MGFEDFCLWAPWLDWRVGSGLNMILNAANTCLCQQLSSLSHWRLTQPAKTMAGLIWINVWSILGPFCVTKSCDKLAVQSQFQTRLAVVLGPVRKEGRDSCEELCDTAVVRGSVGEIAPHLVRARGRLRLDFTHRTTSWAAGTKNVEEVPCRAVAARW
jgi:hypothetical protein